MSEPISQLIYQFEGVSGDEAAAKQQYAIQHVQAQSGRQDSAAPAALTQRAPQQQQQQQQQHLSLPSSQLPYNSRTNNQHHTFC